MKIRLLVGAMLIWAVPAIAQDHTALVAAVKADLVARGVDISGPCGAFQITGRVGYLLRNEGWGLLHKSPGQNGCTTNGDRYAVDFLVHNPSGQGVDMLINSETENIPAWQLFPLPAVPDLTTWRAPFAMDPDPTPPPPPARVWIVSDNLDRRLATPASASAWLRAVLDHSVSLDFRADPRRPVSRAPAGGVRSSATHMADLPFPQRPPASPLARSGSGAPTR